MQYEGLQGRGNADEARFGACPRGAEGRTEAEQPLTPRPPGPPNRAPAGGRDINCFPHLQQTDPPAARRAAPGAWGCEKNLAEQAAGGDAWRHADGRGGGGLARNYKSPLADAGGPGQGTGEGRGGTTARPPPLSPAPPLLSPRDAEGGPRVRRPFTRPAGPGGSPAREGRDTLGGARLGPYATLPHTAPAVTPATGVGTWT